MRQIINSLKKINFLILSITVSIISVSCGSYQSTTYGNDGIYGPNNSNRVYANNQRANTAPQESYFAKKLEQYENDYAGSDVFTDVENYSSQSYDDTQDTYNGGSQYQGWGENTQQNTQVYVNNGWNYGYNNFGYNNYYNPFWNRGFGNQFSYGYNGFRRGPFFNFYYGNPFYYGGYYNNYYWGNNFWFGNRFFNYGFYNNRSYYNNRSRGLVRSSARRSGRVINSNNRSIRSSSNRRVVSPRATNSNSRRTFSTRQSSSNSSARTSRSSRSSSGNFSSSRRSSSSNRSFSPRRSSSSRSSGSLRSSRSSSSRRR